MPTLVGMQVCPNCGEENPARFRLCGFCGTALAVELPPQERRKTVTIFFSDLKGSTNLGEALDSESLREVMTRYFDEMRAILEHHGGRVEKYIGDAIMAVFGLPVVHEDDALRAVRAALATKVALENLNDELEERWGVRLVNRTGVNTGEVVAGDPTEGQRLVIGDAVNTAARLEQAAPALDILIGEPTYRLVRHAVEVDPVEPLPLKGKSEPVPAYRLLAVNDAEGVARSHEQPLVGREEELARLKAALDVTVASGECSLVTVTAPAGGGKSRLIAEFAQAIESDARVVRGRCLPYGRGITFWPLIEIVREAAEIRDDDAPADAQAKVSALVGPGGEDVTERIASAVGISPAQFALEELFWAVRKLFERLAAPRPLVVVFEDVHWAETTLLELVEQLTVSLAGPVLLVCASRPELVDEHPSFADEGELIELRPLSADESEQVIANLFGGGGVPEQARARIVEAAEGNPLFVEQLLAMLVDDRLLRRVGGQWVSEGDLSELAIPPTINALLSARLDLLTLEERGVIEPASVIGLVFQHDALDALVEAPIRSGLAAHLSSLAHKRMIVPEPAAEDEPRYRFHHILIRDAAYTGLLKRARARLHERFADWGERVNRERDREAEYAEILGYHLEQAHEYLAGLGPLDEHGRTLGFRAAGHLESAGRRAFARADMAAAANLLRRAAQLRPEGDRARIELLPDLGEALMEIGEFAWAQVFLDEAVEGATALGDARLEANAKLTRLLVRHHTAEDLEAFRQEVEQEALRAIPILEREGAHAELAKAWRFLGFVHGSVLRYGDAADAVQRAVEHARLAGDRRQEARNASAYTIAALHGPTPVPEAIARCEMLLAQGLANRQAEAFVLRALAQLRAMQGDFDEARGLYDRARQLLDELGFAVLGAAMSIYSGAVEILATNPVHAESELRNAYEALSTMGEKYYLPPVTALLAKAVYEQGRDADAAELARKADELAAADDIEAQALWRGVRARVLAAQGSHGEAEALAREAVELLRSTDAPVKQADALMDLAEVLVKSGQFRAAQAVVEESGRLYEVKQSTVSEQRAQTLLADLLAYREEDDVQAAVAKPP
jgi:predicted ATPase/class 3 adenylate cyclase